MGVSRSILAALTLSVGCSAAPPPTAPASSPHAGPERVTIAADAAPPATRAPGSDTPPTPPSEATPPIPGPLEVPPELAASPAWIGRTYLSGMARRVGVLERHVTYTLQRHGGRAALTVVTKVARQWGDPTLLREQSRIVYLGTATEKDGVVVIDVDTGTDQLALRCKRKTVRAASADAGRAYSAGDLGCGDDGRWKPAVTKPITVLDCGASSNDDALVAFAPAPGIEWVFLRDDCLVGGGWRAVKPDGSVVTPRSPKYH